MTLPHSVEYRVWSSLLSHQSQVSDVVPVGRNHLPDEDWEFLCLPVSARVVVFSREWVQLMWVCEDVSQSNSDSHIMGQSSQLFICSVSNMGNLAIPRGHGIFFLLFGPAFPTITTFLPWLIFN